MKLAALATIAVILGLAAVPAHGQGEIEEFGGFTPAASPCEVEFDRTGLLWTELVGANAIGSVDTTTGAIKQYPLPTPGGIPGGMELGPEGGIWFALWTKVPYGYAASDDVTFGKDGALYFSHIGLSAIGRFDIKTGEFSKYSIPSQPAVPGIIQAGPGTLLAFGGDATNKVGTFDTATRKFKEYSVPGYTTQGVTLGPDNAIWFTSPLGQFFGRIDVTTGDVTTFDIISLRKGAKLPLTAGSPLPTPTTIRTGGDGKLYFDEGGLLFPSFGNKVGQYDPRTGEFKELVTPSPASTPCDLNVQMPWEVWTGLFVANKVARIKVDAKPEYSYCKQVACPDSVPTAPPAAVAAAATTKPKTAGCVSSATTVTARVAPSARGRVVRTKVLVRGKTVRSLGKGKTSTRVRISSQRGGSVAVRLVSKLKSGRSVTVVRRFKLCA